MPVCEKLCERIEVAVATLGINFHPYLDLDFGRWLIMLNYRLQKTDLYCKPLNNHAAFEWIVYILIYKFIVL